MAKKFNFTINEKGVLRPARLEVDRGDIVAFEGTASDIVLCFDPATFFGQKELKSPKEKK